MNDYELILRLREDDPLALETAIKQYSGYVMAVISKTLDSFGTGEDKEELLMDVFVALWKNRMKLADDSKLKFWLAVVARNAVLRHLRKLRLTAPLEDNILEADETEVYLETERKERRAMVRTALDSLADEDKDIFLRHYFWKQKVADIERETGINSSTIKSRLSRGRKKLKAFLIKEAVNYE